MGISIGFLRGGPKTTWHLNYLGCLYKMQIPLITNKGPEYIKISCKSLRTDNPTEKWAQNVNREFTEEEA